MAPVTPMVSPSQSKDICTTLRYFPNLMTVIQNKLSDILTEIKYHRQQVTLVRSEKDTMESVLGMKIADTKKSVLNDAARVRHDMEKSRRT